MCSDSFRRRWRLYGGLALGWIVLAFTSARFAAMGFNRIVDREIGEPVAHGVIGEALAPGARHRRRQGRSAVRL